MASRSRSYSVTEVETAAGAAVREARSGATVDITARGHVVARIVPADEDPVLEPVRKFELPQHTVKLKGRGLASDAVIEDRG